MSVLINRYTQRWRGYFSKIGNFFAKKLKKVPAKEAQADYLGRSSPPEFTPHVWQ
jgi:hypothetical protein